MFIRKGEVWIGRRQQILSSASKVVFLITGELFNCGISEHIWGGVGLYAAKGDWSVM